MTFLNEDTILAEVDTGFAHNTPNSPVEKRFKLLRLLGHGGSSSVFLAWDNQLERQVAIKLLLQTQHNDNLLFEARIQAKIVSSFRKVIMTACVLIC